ncbi:hypothetical protein KBI5_22615 [Frankia sp. KB5]|nr:hypothetical protein KBI5_22615 [Frankia sp. KB5]
MIDSLVLSFFIVGLAVASHDWLIGVAPFIGMLLALLIPVLRSARPPGRVLRPDDEPDLAILIRRAAREMEFDTPLAVRVLPTPVAQVHPGFGGRSPSLLLGWPLLRGLTATQLTAIIAREIARHQLTGWREGALASTRGMVAQALTSRFPPRRAVSAALLNATQRYRWRVELAADARAAEILGTTEVRSVLTRATLVAAAFDHLGGHWTKVLAQQRTFPEDLYDALDEALDDPHVVRWVFAAILTDETRDPWAAHARLPLQPRLAALAELPTSTPARTDIGDAASPGTKRAEASHCRPVGGPAGGPVRIHQADDLNRWAPRELLPDSNQIVLPASVLEGPADLFRPVEEARADLLRATGRGTVPDAVTAAVEALESGPPPAAVPRPSAAHASGDGTAPFQTSGGVLAEAPRAGGRWWARAGRDTGWRGLARRIEPSIRAEPPPGRDALARAVLSDCLGSLISMRLVDSGWERASRWVTAVVISPDGRTVDVRELIEQAVDSGDATQVRALIAASNDTEAIMEAGA